MSTLGVLPNLEILKLKDYAFKGRHWELLDGGFRLLRVLQLGRTDLVQWDAAGHHFPRLQSLVLNHCLNLEAIPIGLAEVSALQNMELHRLKPSAKASAITIQQQKLMIQQEQGPGNSKFKLLIYPPDLESDNRLSLPVVA